MPDIKVTLYMMQDNPHCHSTKQLVTKLGVDFDEIDISGDEKSRQELTEKTGQMSIPALVITKNEHSIIIVGYNPKAIQHALTASD